MNPVEKAALQAVSQDLIADMDAVFVAKKLYYVNMITKGNYRAIIELKGTRRQKCRRLLDIIQQPENTCAFEEFVNAVNCNGVYGFLAERLRDSLRNMQLRGERRNNNVTNTHETNIDAACQKCDALNAPVGKINVIANRRKRVMFVAHILKRFAHDGDELNFRRVQQAVLENSTRSRVKETMDIRKKMELADLQFTALEAEIMSRRVKYVKDESDDDIFAKMNSILPYTTNPSLFSMNYLARYSSVIAMRETIDDGLAFLEYAKAHRECLTPCVDTGMVYYIEVNQLSQKYEQQPSQSLKSTIIEAAENGIAQFRDEDEGVRTDYQRMFMLKMVFIYLGIGLFGKHIAVTTTTEERESAKRIIDTIESSDMWNGMEKRRKMFFYVAKAEYYKQLGNCDLALMHATEAEKLARENSWNAELKNVSNFVEELKSSKK